MTVKALVSYITVGVIALAFVAAVVLLGGYVLMLSWNGSVGAVSGVVDVTWQQGAWFVILVTELMTILSVNKSARGAKKD